jgi:hypothetical protein
MPVGTTLCVAVRVVVVVAGGDGATALQPRDGGVPLAGILGFVTVPGHGSPRGREESLARGGANVTFCHRMVGEGRN